MRLFNIGLNSLTQEILFLLKKTIISALFHKFFLYFKGQTCHAVGFLINSCREFLQFFLYRQITLGFLSQFLRALHHVFFDMINLIQYIETT